MPFKWGHNDCGLFVNGAIKAMSGMSPGFFLEGKYDSKVGALRFLAKFKLKTFEEMIVKLFSETTMQLLPQGDAVMYGDIVLADIDNIDQKAVGATAGVVDRDGLSIFPGKEGLVKIAVTEAKSVWRV
tara:strand:- start:6376 stop:6759 length:384 start_codon:yes stop_codon:yes gene_type:complete